MCAIYIYIYIYVYICFICRSNHTNVCHIYIYIYIYIYVQHKLQFQIAREFASFKAHPCVSDGQNQQSWREVRENQICIWGSCFAICQGTLERQNIFPFERRLLTKGKVSVKRVSTGECIYQLGDQVCLYVGLPWSKSCTEECCNLWQATLALLQPLSK